MANRISLHYLGLTGAIALGAILRFWHLDLKPLWMDEVITAIFSLGKSYNDLPLDVVFPVGRLQEIFTIQPGVSCSQIAQTITTQSTHPPLFFCWMYSWLVWMRPLGGEWVAKLRSLPALFGIAAIVAVYFVNRIAFSRAAGLMAAVVMAVSPFALYLSQEARHYTLPMLLITLALLGLLQIQQDMERLLVRFWVWLGWAIINTIGLYVHYFCILAFIAQIATLLLLMYWHRANMINLRKNWLALILSTSGVAISFLPWLPIMLNHFSRSETDWLPSPKYIAPLYQTLISWVLMVIALPVENQPSLVAVISGLFMVLFSIWVGRQVLKGLMPLWCTPTTHLATLTLLSFFICVLLEFFAIVFLFNKDITIVPRYNFVYYPSFCALIAASLSQRDKHKQTRKKNNFFILHSSLLICLLVGFLSCVFVVSNLVFQKPFQPERVAEKMNQDPSIPLMIVVGYRDYQDVALGLSFALALEPLRESANFAFVKQSRDFADFWQKFSQLPTLGSSKLNLWVVGPGRKQRDYPQQVVLSAQSTCTLDPKHYHRLGVPYQLYRCSKPNA